MPMGFKMCFSSLFISKCQVICSWGQINFSRITMTILKCSFRAIANYVDNFAYLFTVCQLILRISQTDIFIGLLKSFRRMLSPTQVWRDSARRLFWAWIRKRSHHYPKMVALMKWTKQFCWLCLINPFFCTADIPHDMPSKKHCISSAYWFSAFHSQTFLLGSSQALWQSEGKARQGKSSWVELSWVELNCRSNFAISCCPSDFKDGDTDTY
jgi:hypothetical protein